MAFKEEDFLQLSGLQHFHFCRRQWALIHIEHQWSENFQTTDGQIMHQNAHNSNFKESRKDVVIVRGISVFSSTLGVTGQCDVVEFYRSPSGISLNGKNGLWIPYPVEYKRGKPREDISDQLQLCGQAMCLEEMLCCDISEGAIYYGETRRRVSVVFSESLREEVRKSLEEMHLLYQRGYTPKVKASKSCKACSLQDICAPSLSKKASVTTYIKQALEEIE